MSPTSRPIPTPARALQPRAARKAGSRLSFRTLAGYCVALLGVAATTVLLQSTPLARGIANVSMLYLLLVFLTALRFGRGPAILAAVAAYLAIDWYFVSPHSLFANNPDEWIALGIFVLTASVTGQVTAQLKLREEDAIRRERESAALTEASWAVASQISSDPALLEVLHRLQHATEPRGAAILIRRDPHALRVITAEGENRGDEFPLVDPEFRRALDRVFATSTPYGWPEPLPRDGAPCPELAALSLLPLRMEADTLGVLAIRWPDDRVPSTSQQRVVQTLGNHAALVLQRDRLVGIEAHARALQEADRLKTSLLQMVSHDFHSPLTSIKAGINAVRHPEEAEPEVVTEVLDAMDLETERLIGMVDNVLALSQLEAGACQPLREPTLITELIGAALDTFDSSQNDRIQLELEPELTEAWLDPVQMVQVLHNLLENALKYSPPGTHVKLRAFRRGDRLLLEVSDHGPGIPPGEEESIFERFYRGKGLKESAVRGLGLGLALSRGLVEAHGGKLTAVNRYGGGTNFIVELPLAPGREQLQKNTQEQTR